MKKVGSAMYVHKSNLNELLNKLSENEKKRVKSIFDKFDKSFEIVKYDKGKVSLIESDNWDTANEPNVGNSYCFSEASEANYKIVKKSGKIYHNKWMFVSSDYKGFDIETAKQRTKLWNSIPDIKKHKSKIGNKKYWNELLQKNNIPL
jgi:hypothetical protein